MMMEIFTRREAQRSMTDKMDKEVNVGKNVPAITALQLIDELYVKGSKARNNYLVKADRNERFVHGEQYTDINRLTGVIQDVPWQDFVPKVTVNLLRNLVLTWTSRILRNRPSVSAYPNNAEVADAQSAEAAAVPLLATVQSTCMYCPAIPAAGTVKSSASKSGASSVIVINCELILLSSNPFS